MTSPFTTLKNLKDQTTEEEEGKKKKRKKKRAYKKIDG